MICTRDDEPLGMNEHGFVVGQAKPSPQDGTGRQLPSRPLTHAIEGAIAWTPCDRIAPTALARTRCGSIDMPLDRSSVRRGTTKIAFALMRRLDTFRPSLGAVVLSSVARRPVA